MNSEQEEAPTLEFFTSKVLQEKDKDMLKGLLYDYMRDTRWPLEQKSLNHFIYEKYCIIATAFGSFGGEFQDTMEDLYKSVMGNDVKETINLENWNLLAGKYNQRKRKWINIAQDFIQNLRARARRTVGRGNTTAAPVGGVPGPGHVASGDSDDTATLSNYLIASEHFIKEEEEQYAMEEQE